MPLRIGVVGLGRWGPNHVRVFSAMPDCRVVACADPSEPARNRIAGSFKDVELSADCHAVLQHKDIDAVVICTPTSTHFSMVKEALEAGKHVLCEKPLTNNSKEAWELVALAKARGKQLQVGHVFLCNPGIEFLCSAVRNGLSGWPYYVNAVRTNLGPFRSDVNAAWDLASHDIYIFNEILGERPTWVSAVGGSYLRKPIEDIVFLTMQYPRGVLGHIHVSWLDPKKIRQITVVGESKMITWDEFGTPGPVMIYDRAVMREPFYSTFGEFQLLAREGDVILPRITMQEPLNRQAKLFFDRCVGAPGVQQTGGSGKQGAEVVDILEAAALSLKDEGRREDVRYGG